MGAGSQTLAKVYNKGAFYSKMFFIHMNFAAPESSQRKLFLP